MNPDLSTLHASSSSRRRPARPSFSTRISSASAAVEGGRDGSLGHDTEQQVAEQEIEEIKRYEVSPVQVPVLSERAKGILQDFSTIGLRAPSVRMPYLCRYLLTPL